jgi:hypothetical protein
VALLANMMRTAAITGRPDLVNAWCADRQGGRWAEQMVRSAYPYPHPSAPPPRNPEETARALNDLHDRGIVTDAELAKLRARLLP